ncbi:MAG: hypothetical protein RBS24_06305 [Bacilli bacterium]|jgi:hypothetical protein|nr:hypothetical protein [Bacilli bacterium]
MNTYERGKEYLLYWNVPTKKGEGTTIVTFDKFLTKGHEFTFEEYKDVYQTTPGKGKPPVILRTDIFVFRRVSSNGSIVIPDTPDIGKYVIVEELSK